MYKLLASIIAVSTSEIVDTGKTIGTASNQVILGMLVVALILVVVYREYQQIRVNRKAEIRHHEAMTKADTQFTKLIDQQSKDRTAWDDERRARIAMLMTLVQDNTRAMDKTANAVLQTNVVISDLKEVINGFKEVMFKLEHTLAKA